ncbi:MAG: ribonuclease H-like domain-containing protein [Candidatus Diapherotrites archaeon]|nr:ribonuclease H-like domain-containing protein [Candidatus Diapherotrites archaeon]
MGNFYLDIETTGLDSQKDKIITIQFQELDKNSGEALGELVILKEWESSERDIIRQFIEKTRIADPYPFAFVPVGYNLNFEHNFLKERTALHSFTPLDILSKPFIDLRPFGIIMNRGEFKGSGLDKITAKPMNGRLVPQWYFAREFDRIVDYVRTETAAFIELNAWLHREMPLFLERFKQEHYIK